MPIWQSSSWAEQLQAAAPRACLAETFSHRTVQSREIGKFSYVAIITILRQCSGGCMLTRSMPSVGSTYASRRSSQRLFENHRWEIRRSNKLLVATWIMASETSRRFS